MSEALKRLSVLADEQFAAEAKVVQLETELEAAKRDLATIAETRIPELMEELGMEDFTTTSGLKVVAKPTLVGSLPKGGREAALAWLREHELGGIIKTNVVVPFSKGDDNDAREFVEELEGEGVAAQLVSDVNHMTLKAQAKKLLEDGVDVPLEKLGLHRKTVAKVSQS